MKIIIYVKEQIAPRYHNHYTDNEFELIATISGVGLKARLAMSDYAQILPQKNFKVKFKGKNFNPFLALCFCLKSRQNLSENTKDLNVIFI